MNQRAVSAVHGLWIAAALASSGCGPRPEPVPAASPTEIEAADAGYLSPPAVTAVRTGAEGHVLEGSGPAGDRLRLVEAGGGTYGSEINARGRWTLPAPRRAGVRLFSLSSESEGRVLQGEGRLLVLPDGRAFLLRPGYGALPVGRSAGGPPRIVSIDVAVDGAAAVSGFARPSARAVTVVDGAPPQEDVVVGQGATDAEGRFAIILASPLTPGPHSVVVNTPDGVARAEVTVFAAADPGTRQYVALQDGASWRVSWRLPRGGVQSTYLFGAPG